MKLTARIRNKHKNVEKMWNYALPVIIYILPTWSYTIILARSERNNPHSVSEYPSINGTVHFFFRALFVPSKVTETTERLIE